MEHLNDQIEKKRKREDQDKFHLNEGEEHTDKKVELLFKNLSC